MNTAIADPVPTTVIAPKKPSLVAKFASRFGVDADKLLTTLKSTCFKQQPDRQGNIAEVSNEEMMALLVVADQYHLNPFTREIYAFRDFKRGGIVPIVGIDGWIRIVTTHPQYAGSTFAYGTNPQSGKLEWVECTMYRKDREHPMTVREYMNENKRDTDPWTQMSSRMLRHRAFIQSARYAFGFVGLYDEDEGRAIIEGTATVAAGSGTITDINAEVTGKKPEQAEPELPLFTFDQVKAALENAATADHEVWTLALDMVDHVADPAERAKLEHRANEIMHQRADREAAAQE